MTLAPVTGMNHYRTRSITTKTATFCAAIFLTSLVLVGCGNQTLGNVPLSPSSFSGTPGFDTADAATAPAFDAFGGAGKGGPGKGKDGKKGDETSTTDPVDDDDDAEDMPGDDDADDPADDDTDADEDDADEDDTDEDDVDDDDVDEDDADEDGDDHDGGTGRSPHHGEGPLSGTVSNLRGACPDVTFNIKGMTIVTVEATTFEGGTCETLRPNATVHVTGTRVAGRRMFEAETITITRTH